MNSSALLERNIIHEFFSPQQEYNNWIRENLDRIGITDETVRSYFTLDVEFWAGETKMQNASWLIDIHVFCIRFNICIFEMTSYKSDKILYIFGFIFLNLTMAKQPLQN